MRKNLSQNWKSIIFYILIPIMLIGSIFLFSGQNRNTATTNYSDIVNLFRTEQVSEYELDLSSGQLTYKLTTDKKGTVNKYTVPSVSYFLDDISDYVKDYNDAHPDKPISYNYKKGSTNTWWMSMLPTFIFTIIIVLLFLWLMRKMTGSISNETNRTLSFGKIKSKTQSGEESDKKFEDVAGCEEEKAELEELVDFLKNSEKYTELGARIPKGVLLVGPPGTGKTLLAKAVAGEAGAPFLSISGSDFVEMYVGVGASRVRDLFEQAKKNRPCIVFIDEIDAVGRKRGAGMGGGHDEREQTLNQLLVEMDGFGENQGVIVIAATNRPDILDPALLRPGRFDRQVTVSYPDIDGREAILKVHAKRKPLGPDVDLRSIASQTVGFTGADLENLLNEAALLAARRKKKAITMPDIEEAAMKVLVGTEKKSHRMTERDKKITAYHEAGHAVTSYYLEHKDPVTHISIVPRGMAGGFTMYLPEKDPSYVTKTAMNENIVCLLGGRVAEQLVLDDISTGASNDLQRATDTARAMVTRYGFSERMGPVVYGTDPGETFLGRDFGQGKGYSENTASEIDNEIRDIMDESYETARRILTEHMTELHRVAGVLMEREKISGEEFDALMKGENLAPFGLGTPAPAAAPASAEQPAAPEQPSEPSDEN